MTIENFKREFAVGGEWIHLNNSGRAPIPRVTQIAMKNWLDRLHTEGAHCEPEFMAAGSEVRDQLAKLVNASKSQVAIFANVSSAISQLAFGLDLKPEDEIIVWDQEYPANFYPWSLAAERAGAKLVVAKSENWQTPASKILDCVTAKTKVIAVSWVQFQTGSVTDLEAISAAVKGKDIFLVADVIQGLGVRQFDFVKSGFDVIVGGCHKWLVSVPSVGFLIGKSETAFDKVRPVIVGAKTFNVLDTQNDIHATMKQGAGKFEPSYIPALLALGFAQSLKLINSTGVANIEAEANRIAQLLRENIKTAGFEIVPSNGSIVSFGVKSQAQLSEIEQLLQKKKITYGKRGPGIRLSAHAFNIDQDVRIF